MRLRHFGLTAAMIGGTLHAAILPIKPGAYVLANVPCRDPAFAAMFSYNGRQFSYPHATACRSIILSRKGRTYKIEETCSAAGDGSATAPSEAVKTYRILSSKILSVTNQTGGRNLVYRLCPAG